MEITYDDFKKVQIKVGTVLEVKVNEKARKPSLVVKVDFGKEIGIKQSSAQITHYYNAESLVGKQVIGVCNFPTKNIAVVNDANNMHAQALTTIHFQGLISHFNAYIRSALIHRND